MSWKKSEFKGSDSVPRLQRLQHLCTSVQADGLLIIGGMDSCHSHICQSLLKYLFLGSSGQELLGEQVIAQEHEILENVVLLICPQRVAIFYSSEPDAAMKILPVISKWRHVTEYVYHCEMDQDDQEERKMTAFKRMMEGIQCVGIPFGLDCQGNNLQDTMVPEQWPLVQSYGLERDDCTGKSFLTMTHDVVNVSRQVIKVLAQLDTFSAKRIVDESQQLLAYHFDDLVRNLNHAASPNARSTMSESDVGEALLSFYEFGTMQYSARGLEPLQTRGCRVLFGKRTSNLIQPSSSASLLANSGPTEDMAATHMVIQAEDPFTGVRFARTYFLSSGKICHKLVDQDALVLSAENSTLSESRGASDTRNMINLYVILLQGFKAATDELIRCCRDQKLSSRDQFVDSARTKAISAITTPFQLLNLDTISDQFIDDQLRLSVEFMDACGLAVDQPHKDWTLLYCSLELPNIPSTVTPSATIGSLVVGDTFLLRRCREIPHQASELALSVTKSFPSFLSWIQDGKEAQAVEMFMQTLQSEYILQSRSVSLGKPIAFANEAATTKVKAPLAALVTKASLLLDSPLMPIVHGSWSLYTGGLVFQSPHFNPIVVSIEKHVTSLTLMPLAYDNLVLLKLHLKEDIHSHKTPLSDSLPFSLDSQALYIPLLSGTRFQNDVLRALEAWKETTRTINVPVYRTSDLHETVPDHKVANFQVPFHVQSTCDFLVRKQAFVGLDAQTLDELFPVDFISKDPDVGIPFATPTTEELKNLSVPVTVLLGIPGSQTKAMAHSICNISSVSFHWIPVDVDLRTLDASKQQTLEASGHLLVYDKVARALEHVNSSIKRLRLSPRIMLSVVGYIDPITVACAIQRAAKDVAFPSKIGAFINCLSATNVYLPDPLQTQTPFPKLVDQMTAGFVTHMVLTHTSDVPLAHLERLRFRMDQVNPFADVMVLSRDVFEGPLTSLLAVDRFDNADYQTYRHVHFRDWESSTSTRISPYVAEMEPLHAPETFRFELVPGINRSKFLARIVKTLTPFATLTKAINRVYPMDTKQRGKGIRLAQSIALEKVRQNAIPSVASFSSYPDMKEVFSHGNDSSCWCVEGHVIFKEEPTILYSYLSSGTFARLWPSSDEIPDNANAFTSTTLTITGRGLNRDKLRELLLDCYACTESSLNEFRSKATISLDEKREIQRQHAMDPLPEGFLFDGTNYVDFFGGRYEFHPCIAQFIDKYINAVNNDTKAMERKIQREQDIQQSFVKQIM